MSELRGKSAIVTGGTRGIGRAVALALASQGANVLINHRASSAEALEVLSEIEQHGVKGAVCQTDLAERDAARHTVQAAVDAFGGLDILINNAGISHLQRLGEGGDWTASDHVWAVNTFGVINMIRAAAEVMADGGRIVTIGSVSGSMAGMPGAADYCGSKAAVGGYSRGAAHDLAARRITVNMIESGMMSTDMALGMPKADQARILAGIPVGRFGDLSEISSLVCYLASPAAAYITGATMTIDGGYSA